MPEKVHPMLPDYFEFSLPTRVMYGIGVINQLNEAVASYGPRRALLVIPNTTKKILYVVAGIIPIFCRALMIKFL